jgi:hypothetical protein
MCTCSVGDDVPASEKDLATRSHWDAEWARARKPLPFGAVWSDRVLPGAGVEGPSSTRSL